MLPQTLFTEIESRYGVVPEYLWRDAPDYAVFRHAENRKWFAVLMNPPGRKLGLATEDEVAILNVKIRAGENSLLRGMDAVLTADLPALVATLTRHIADLSATQDNLADSLAALREYQPDCILLEGPPEADALLPLAAEADMQPPVALLAYRPDAPQQAVYYPFATFSPEWQAIRYAAQAGIPLQFFDLPRAYSFYKEETPDDSDENAAEDAAPEDDEIDSEDGGEAEDKDTAEEPRHSDPFDELAAIAVALLQGYVVASPGARGRTEANGRAPAAIVDLKAAVRYLKANDAKMAGDARKIISNGTSAGGALSALLGTSGNAREYAPYLRALGAANATDDVFAVSAYCPITNLEHADAAYEWQFNGVNDYEKIDISMIDYHVERKTVRGTQTAEQIRLSDGLKNLFPAYVNSLKLKNAQGVPMTLDNNGNGSFKAQIETMLAQSAQKALDEGKDLSGQTWLTIENGKVKAADFSAYAKFVGRQKTAPAFDGVDLSTGENNLFGDAQTQAKHFTAFGARNSTVQGAQTADAATVRIMNAMNFIRRGGTQHYRIRVGENDRDTSLAISQLLALKLRAHGKNVDYALPWGVGHSGDYDLDELFAWMKDVSTRK